MRKFGIEIELNSFDKRDFKINPLFKKEKPEGIEYVAGLLEKLNKEVVITDWQYTCNNKNWVCKPDSSCGIELCSPVLDDFFEVVEVIEYLSKDEKIMADTRCSFHVHFDISDFLFYENYVDHRKINFAKSLNLCSVLCWWIKCEAIFFDSIPDTRKLNKYCQCIGLLDLFDVNQIDCSEIVDKLSNKYLSINTYHLVKNRRPTIEFRIADNAACLDSYFAKNWILFLDNFISKAVLKGLPDSLSWLDPKDFFEFLEINNSELGSWFLQRVFTNIKSDVSYWNSFRNRSFFEFKEILNCVQLDKQICSYLCEKDK
jgi:hypothetical protein